MTVNIAFRPQSGDLILMNAGLAKPILGNLVYSKTSRMGLCAFCNAQYPGAGAVGKRLAALLSRLGVRVAETPAEDVQPIVAEKHLVVANEGWNAEDATGIGALRVVGQRLPSL